MARHRTVHRCASCRSVALRWQGRCARCGEWNTLVEETERSGSGVSGPAVTALTDVESTDPLVLPTGQGELDRVLGGGLTPGSVTLLGGEPGIGKSTLLLQVGASLAATGRSVLYLSAEEAASQVRRRAERLGCSVANLWLVTSTSLDGLDEVLSDVVPDVLLVDSIQAVTDSSSIAAAGSVAQVRECAFQLAERARQRPMAVILAGHVTKDGSLAGPKVLEHLVDTVLSFEGDTSEGLRLLRATKHRFGATNEVGVLEMGPEGLAAVSDPSGRFLADRPSGVAGSLVCAALTGRRPLLVEIQALVGTSSLGTPRRAAQGLDSGRLALLLAVLERRMGLAPLGRLDVHTLAVGGLRVAEPGTDLAVALAVASALTDTPLPQDMVAFGEIGLAGELRQVSRGPERFSEASRLGYRRVLCPARMSESAQGGDVVAISSLEEAFEAVGLPTDGTHLVEVVS